MRYLALISAFLINSIAFSQNISALSPSVGAPTETLSISITGSGTNFTSGNEAARLVYYTQGSIATYINGSNTAVTSDTQMSSSFTLTNTIGKWDVEVYNSTDGWVFLDDGFSIFNADISTNPTSAELNENLSVSITGTNTNFGSGISSVQLIKNATQTVTINGTNTQVSNNTSATTQFSIPSNAPVGLYKLAVTYNNYTVTKQNYFEITPEANASAISSILPSNTVQEGKYHALLFKGQNFTNDIDSIVFTNGGDRLTAQSFSFGSSDSISVAITIPDNENIGQWTPNIYTQSGTITYSGFLNIINNQDNDPDFKSIDPNYADQGDNLSVTITGNTFNKFNQGVNSVQLIQNGTSTTTINGSNLSVVNDSTITADFSIGSSDAIGYYTLKINSISDPLSEAGAFFVNSNNTGPGTISGNINDDNKASSKTYIIRLLDAATHEVVQTTSNDGNGDYTFDQLQFGTYYIETDGLSSNQSTQEFTISNSVLQLVVDIEVVANGKQIITNTKNIKPLRTLIYPNPVVDHITIQTNTIQQEYKNIEVYSFNGTLLFTEGSSDNMFSLSMKQFPAGIYILKVSGEDFYDVHQIIKK